MRKHGVRTFGELPGAEQEDFNTAFAEACLQLEGGPDETAPHAESRLNGGELPEGEEP